MPHAYLYQQTLLATLATPSKHAPLRRIKTSGARRQTADLDFRNYRIPVGSAEPDSE